ncbi:MFS transporter [Motilibacter sp. K478]|nr:MFS transporter [Motilibacter aurantiacus]
MWGVAVLAYLVAVFHRSSLGVASIEASDRLGATAALLSLLSLVQLAVYAAMQIPVGLLLDRFGSRRLIATGGLLMALGQLALATTQSLPAAVAARAVLGCGDALTFISVLRLVAVWLPPKRNPVFVQLTGQIGALGAVAASYPLVAALHGPGWGAAFGTAALVGGAVTLLAALVVRDAPTGRAVRRAEPDGAAVRRQLAASWREPGTRLGFWTHLVTQFSGTVFTLLWGYPFLVIAEDRSPGTAAGLLTLLTLTSVVVGPLMGALIGRHPFHRSWVVLGVVSSTALAWGLVLAWPGQAPMALLVLLVLVLGVNGPGAMIGFDYARTFNPMTRMGSATGIVNVGGFFSALLVIVAVGAVVSALSPDGGYGAAALRWGLTVQYVVWAVGAFQVVRLRRLARSRLAADDPDAYAALRRGEVRPVRA